MPKTVTLATMRATVRFRGDFDNSRVMSDARIDEAINDGTAAVWDVLLRARPDYYVTTQTPTTTPGTATVALATDFYRLRKVELLLGSDYHRLMPVDLTATNRFAATGEPCRYRLQGSTLVLVPTPAAAYSLRIYYLPYYPTLDDDADTFDGISGYEELITLEACYRLKMREGMPVEELLREIGRQQQGIREAASDWDATEPTYLNPTGYDAGGNGDLY